MVNQLYFELVMEKIIGINAFIQEKIFLHKINLDDNQRHLVSFLNSLASLTFLVHHQMKEILLSITRKRRNFRYFRKRQKSIVAL